MADSVSPEVAARPITGAKWTVGAVGLVVVHSADTSSWVSFISVGGVNAAPRCIRTTTGRPLR